MSIIKAQTASLLAIALGFGLTAPAFATSLEADDTSEDISVTSFAAADDDSTDNATDSNDDAAMDNDMTTEDEESTEDTTDEEDTTPAAQ